MTHKTLLSPHSNHCPQKRGGFFKIPFTEEVKVILKRKAEWDFPGGPVVKTLRFQCSGCGFDPWSGKLRSHMPRCARPKNKKKEKKSWVHTSQAHFHLDYWHNSLESNESHLVHINSISLKSYYSLTYTNSPNKSHYSFLLNKILICLILEVKCTNSVSMPGLMTVSLAKRE